MVMHAHAPPLLRRLLTVASASVLAGCLGAIGDPSEGASSPADGPVDPDPACDEATPTPYVPLARLTSHELRSTLRDLLPSTTVAAIDRDLALLPDDAAGDEIDSVGREITSAHVRAHAAIADAAAAHLASVLEARAELAPCFATTADRACVAELVEGWGARAWRRPLDPSEVEETMALYDDVVSASGSELGLRAVFSTLLLAPELLMRVEIGASDPIAGEVLLTPYELASRLAFVLWGQGPDSSLEDAAQSGALDDPDALAAEVDRMLADPRAHAHLTHFVSQWLILDRDLGIDDVAPHVAVDLETDGLSAAASEELRTLIEHLVWEEEAGLSELLTTDLSFVAHPGLASIYGVAANDGSSPVALGDARRGLLTRVAFLADPGGAQHPIYRGRRVRERLLCGTLYPPDPDTLPEGSLAEPPLEPVRSSRERYEEHTAGPLCAGCHRQINPLGFALGGFDGMGRMQTVERVYDEEGALLGEAPVDTAVDPALEREGEHHVDGAAELGALIATEPLAFQCAATRYVEATVGRRAAASDACAVDASAERLSGSRGFIEMIRGLVTDRAFRRRTIEP